MTTPQPQPNSLQATLTSLKQSLGTLRQYLAELNLEHAAAKPNPLKAYYCDEYDRIGQNMRNSEQDLHRTIRALKQGATLQTVYPAGARVIPCTYGAHAQMLLRHVEYLVYEFHELSSDVHRDIRFRNAQLSVMPMLWLEVSNRTLQLFDYPVRDSRGVLSERQHARALKMATYEVQAMLSRLDFLGQEGHEFSEMRERMVQRMERLRTLRAVSTRTAGQDPVVDSAEDEASPVQAGGSETEVPIMIVLDD